MDYSKASWCVVPQGQPKIPLAREAKRLEETQRGLEEGERGRTCRYWDSSPLHSPYLLWYVTEWSSDNRAVIISEKGETGRKVTNRVSTRVDGNLGWDGEFKGKAATFTLGEIVQRLMGERNVRTASFFQGRKGKENSSLIHLIRM